MNSTDNKRAQSSGNSATGYQQPPPYVQSPGYGYDPRFHPPSPPYSGPAQAPYPGQPPVQAANASASDTSRFIKGAVFGAAAAYLLTNETVQQTTIKTLVKAWSFMQGGVEELKERFKDAEAELHTSGIEEE